MGSIRTFDIKQIKDKLKINTFIETGTLWRHGVDYAIESGFNKIISIEINEDLAEKAKEKYKNDDRVTIICGNSSKVLKDILTDIKEPVLFWLDAHFPGVDAHLAAFKAGIDSNKNVPLEIELDIISRRLINDVIICDDLWLYEDVPQSSWPTFNEHCRQCGHNIKREDLVKDGMPAIFEKMFNKTHVMTRDFHDQGFLIFTPHEKNIP
jgi:hypothetical protein